jgi:hypothetical protein
MSLRLESSDNVVMPNEKSEELSQVYSNSIPCHKIFGQCLASTNPHLFDLSCLNYHIQKLSVEQRKDRSERLRARLIND